MKPYMESSIIMFCLVGIFIIVFAGAIALDKNRHERKRAAQDYVVNCEIMRDRLTMQE